MATPLILLHIPALVAYVLSENAVKDLFPRRQNACVVVEEFAKAARGDPACLAKAVEKCKGVSKDPLTLTIKTLAAMHDALSKNTPEIARPVTDPEDTCDLQGWNADRSFVRELFGAQLETDGELQHPLVLALEATGNSLVKCVRDALGNATVRRAPLVLVCGFKANKKFVEYPYDFDFSGIKYTLCAVTTPEKSLYEKADGPGWVSDLDEDVPVNAIVVNDACVLAYRRKRFTP